MQNHPQQQPAYPESPVDDIVWLQEALFGQTSGLISRARRGSSALTDMYWVGLPVRGAIRRLVPAASRFAAEAFTNRHDAMSSTRRMLGHVAHVSTRFGALRLAPQFRADASTVFGDPDRSVIAAAAVGLGQPIRSCAITLGPQRYNRKPVVQLMNDDARTVGFLKVGADVMTSAMVATEAAAINRLQPPTNPLLAVPQVLWQSEWNGRTVACFSPVGRQGRKLVPADATRLAAVATAVIEAGGGRHDVELPRSGPITRLRAEADRADNAGSDIHRLLDRIEAAFGNHTVSLAPWHGDFSPWNMISTARSTALLDWEFAGDEMAVGSDLLHHRIMVATHLAGEPVQTPLQQLVAAGYDVPELHAMAVPHDQHRPHLVLYLLELIRRDLELERVGLSTTGFGGPAVNATELILAQVTSK